MLGRGIGRRLGSPQRGFTLLEIAIVVSVIGVIIGAMFAAGPTAQYHVTLNRALDDIALIRDNMRTLYTNQNIANIPTQTFSTTFDTQLVSQGVFPADMLANGYAYHPWNQAVAGGSVQLALQHTTPMQFIIRFLSIADDVCTDLVTRSSLPGPDTGLIQIIVTGASTTAFTDALKQLPVTPTAATGACRPGSTYTIDWYFKLGA